MQPKIFLAFAVCICFAALFCNTVDSAGFCSCCEQNEGWPIFEVNLTSGQFYIAPESGIQWKVQPPLITYKPRYTCNLEGVLKIAFPVSINRMQNRFLRIDLFLDSKATGWNFHIGDSKTNSGFGGDDGTTSNDAEVHNVDDDWFVYSNGLPGNSDYTVSGLLVDRLNGVITNRVTITIGDEYVEFDNNRGVRRRYRSEYLFTLSGQKPTVGELDYDIFLAMNRVIMHYTSRTGIGLCGAVIRALEC